MNIQRNTDDYCVLGTKTSVSKISCTPYSSYAASSSASRNSSRNANEYLSPIIWDNFNTDSAASSSSSSPSTIDRLVMSSSLASILARASLPIISSSSSSSFAASASHHPLKTKIVAKRRCENSFIVGRPSLSVVPEATALPLSVSAEQQGELEKGQGHLSQQEETSSSSESKYSTPKTFLSSGENWAVMPKLSTDASSSAAEEKSTFHEAVSSDFDMIPSSRKRETYYPSLCANSITGESSNKRRRRFPNAA